MKNINRDLQLTSGSVLLRPYRLSDVDAVYEAVLESKAELSPRMYWYHPGYSIEEARTWVESCDEAWERESEYRFAITDSGSGVFLGSCALTIVNREFGVAEIGYYVRTNRTKQGVATTAVSLVIQFGFNKLKLNRMEIVIMVDNAASQRVAEKAGAIREGILRNRIIVREKAYNAVLFSLIPQDLNPKQEYSVRPLNQQDHAWVVNVLEQYWSSTRMVTRRTVHDADQLPGFIALQNDRPVGLIIYRLHNNECEIVILNSLVEGRGVGSALLETVRDVAISANCKRLWLITTNDNTPALGFYQKRDFLLVALHRNAVKYSRKLKPEIPLVGINNIPLRDEIELELPLLQ